MNRLHYQFLDCDSHILDGKQKTLLVHRKGSTRAFPPHHPLIPVDYQVSGSTWSLSGYFSHCSILNWQDGQQYETPDT